MSLFHKICFVSQTSKGNKMNIIEKYSELPVSVIAGEVCTALAAHPVLIVTAPPGAGKSTLLPLALLEQIPSGKILMLEPRRLAARQVAARMASMLEEPLGKTVGYRVRFENCTSSDTRIEVITEGILERMLVDDPTLEGVQYVIFDEYHERSLSSDLSLALTREIQNIIRPDLRILIMSATIDAEHLTRTLNARHIHSPGKNFDVDIIYSEDFDFRDCATVVARAVSKAFRNHDGNILAFLPGQGEILKCRELLEANMPDAEILTLYGAMPHKQQYDVMSRPEKTKRRVVLASPIAETSLTIEGITVVVDSGLHRIPAYEPTTGLSRLVTTQISKDMATQRAGRAGRLSSGVCYRLWSKASYLRMKECRQPEIETADLSSMMITTAAWGETDPMRLPWVTTPPVGHLASARKLLKLLDAIDDNGYLTRKGESISHLPCHPRIASMLVEAGDLKPVACDVAALLEEKDPLTDVSDADISTRIFMLMQHRNGKNLASLRRIDHISMQYRRLVKVRPHRGDIEAEKIGQLVAMAYPERIAMRDEHGNYRLASGGESVSLLPDDDLARHEFLAIASMSTRIFLAAPIDKEFLLSLAKWRELAIWNSREGKAMVREELTLGSLTLASRPAKGNVREKIASAIAESAPKEGLTMFDFNDEVQSLQLRITVASAWHPELEFPDVSTAKVLSIAGEWLPMYIGDATSVQELRKIDISNVILSLLTFEQQQALERIVPTHLKLPNGRNARIHYRRGADAPIVSARLQDCFGMTETPRVDEGKRKVLMELLSPGFKPVQLTQDMEGFWRTTYFEIRKELRRRYPKHNWPENP